jgi:ribosomal-protein-alanine N-acetyltransferase
MLTSALCHIRHFRNSDLIHVFEYRRNMEARGAYFPYVMQSEHLAHKEFQENGFSTEQCERLGIFTSEGALVGEIAHFKGKTATTREIGYFLFEQQARGRGYTSEAVRLLSDYLFRRSAEINRLEILMAVDNLASEKTAQKAGYIKEGRLRSYLYMNGDYHDAYMYSLLRSDWQSQMQESIQHKQA